MEPGTLVLCLNHYGWLYTDNGIVHNYGPQYREICVVKDIQANAYISLQEYPKLAPDGTHHFYDNRLFIKLQDPMELNLESLTETLELECPK